MWGRLWSTSPKASQLRFTGLSKAPSCCAVLRTSCHVASVCIRMIHSAGFKEGRALRYKVGTGKCPCPHGAGRPCQCPKPPSLLVHETCVFCSKGRNPWRGMQVPSSHSNTAWQTSPDSLSAVFPCGSAVTGPHVSQAARAAGLR